MPPGKPLPSPELAAWEAFAARRAGNPHLGADPLYALPEDLIDVLKVELPGFFDDGEDAFELDLARTTEGGLFFRRRVVPCLLLGKPVDARQADADVLIREALVEEMEASGVNRHMIKSFDMRQAEFERRADLRAAAFVGWLVTNARFLAERDALKKRYGSVVKSNEGFPCLPRSFLGESSGTTSCRKGRFFLFYRRWNLCSFLTWDLPLPLRPEFGVMTLDTWSLQCAGITVFMPWYVVEDGRFSADAMADHLKAFQRPAHLKGWLKTPAGRGKTLGDIRYERYLKLYRYWDLVLKRRYPGRLAGKTMQLDWAFARFIGCKADTVKKIRNAVRRAAEADGG